MTNSLHQEPERDEFKHESPIRAFTTWSVQGLYALGKGFRPSLQHLVPYLNAMEGKEGWRLVQVLEAATGSPSFIFRLEREPSDDELRARYPHLDFQLPAKVATGLRQVTGDMVHAIKGTTWPHKRKEEFYGFADRVNGYAAELEAREEPYVRNREGFEEAGRKIDQAREMDAAMRSADKWTDHGSDIDIPVEYHEEALRFIADKRGMNADRLVKDFMLYFKERNQPNQVTHKTFYQQLQFVLPSANALELKQLIDQFRVSKQPPVSAIGEEVTSAPPVSAIGDDPINPKHYAGRECADIGERLSANGYQILKYCWRLGKKDDPCQELGKAIWYGESESELLRVLARAQGWRAVRPNLTGIKDPAAFLEDRIADQPQFTQNIARMLWAGYGQRELRAILEAIQEHRFHLDCGRGLAI